jgi:hypothetical protein
VRRPPPRARSSSRRWRRCTSLIPRPRPSIAVPASCSGTKVVQLELGTNSSKKKLNISFVPNTTTVEDWDHCAHRCSSPARSLSRADAFSAPQVGTPCAAVPAARHNQRQRTRHTRRGTSTHGSSCFTTPEAPTHGARERTRTEPAPAHRVANIFTLRPHNHMPPPHHLLPPSHLPPWCPPRRHLCLFQTKQKKSPKKQKTKKFSKNRVLTIDEV